MNKGDGLMLTFDGATGYFPKEFIIDAIKTHMKRGEWKLGKSGVMYFCSSCGYAAHPREEEEWNFCPNCGAKMKGGDNNEHTD